MRLKKTFALVLLGILCACTGQPSRQHTDETTVTQSTRSGGEFAYATETEIGVVRGGQVAARLPRRDHGAGVPLTRDGRFLYVAGDDAVSILDIRNLQRREVSCDSACQGSLRPLLPLGDGLIGGFDTGGMGGGDGKTDVAAVKALDLADAGAIPKTLGEVKLAFPHPVHSQLLSEVQPYSFFLDAATGEYLFLDFASTTVPDSRPWEQRQILHLAKLDGTLLDLGEYAFPAVSAVWGAIGPDGRQFVVGDWNSQAADGASRDHCEETGMNLFDTSTGMKVTIAPPAEVPGPRDYRVTRAWWGRSGTLYVTLQQQACVPFVPGTHTQDPPPLVWAYRDGQWTRLSTPGPAIQALDLGDGRFAVIQPATPKPIGFTTEYDLAKGSLVIIDPEGRQTHIADDVTALAELPSGP